MQNYQEQTNPSLTYLTCFDRILQDMIQGMTRPHSGSSISGLFICQMIPHHERAIKMSENALRFPICQQLIPILDAIIISQKEGVRQMKQLLEIAASPFDRDYI